MISEAIFSDNCGQGLIITGGDEDWRKEEVVLGNCKLVPGGATTLDGYFSRPVIYCGIRKESELVFFLGSVQDLFPASYYETMNILSPVRFFRMFSPNAGRDFNFVGGIWK